MEKEINRGRKKKDIDGEFAEILSQLLQEAKEKGISQDSIAQAIGVSRQSLGKWANGVTVPDILDLKKLAEYFNVSADYLLGLSENATTDIELKAVCDYTGLSEKAVKKLVDEKNEGFVDCIDVLSWLISQEYALELCNLLNDINFSSELYEIDLQEYQKKFNSFAEQIKTNNYTTVNQLNELENLDSDLNETFDKIDVARYRLIKFSESLSNIFDNRKEPNLTENTPELLFTVNQLRRQDNQAALWRYLKKNDMLRKEAPDNGNDNPQEE